jgi:hypothetical protein
VLLPLLPLLPLRLLLPLLLTLHTFFLNLSMRLLFFFWPRYCWEHSVEMRLQQCGVDSQRQRQEQQQA